MPLASRDQVVQPVVRIPVRLLLEWRAGEARNLVPQRLQPVGGDPPGSERRRLGLEQRADAHALKKLARGDPAHGVGARALLEQEPLRLEAQQGLADRRARNVEALGEPALDDHLAAGEAPG